MCVQGDEAMMTLTQYTDQCVSNERIADLPLTEWCDYWKHGNAEQWAADGIELSRLDLIHELCAAAQVIRRLLAELKPFQPMSLEEIDAELAAMDDGEAIPMLPEDIESAVKYATDPEYRAAYLYKRYVQMLRVNRGLRTEVNRLLTACEGIDGALSVSDEVNCCCLAEMRAVRDAIFAARKSMKPESGATDA